jgi:hypothetical protein
MPNAKTNNPHSIDLNATSSSSSIITLATMLSSPMTDPVCVTSPSHLSTTPRRIVKAKRSLVWRYFSIIKGDELNVECVLCSSTILRKSTSTSNLLHHMQTQHNSEYQNINKSMKSQMRTSDSSPRLPLTSDRSIYLTKLIADFIICNFLPLSIVECPQLQRILEEAEPSYIIPKRKYFVNNVFQDMYFKLREKVYDELQLASGK